MRRAGCGRSRRDRLKPEDTAQALVAGCDWLALSTVDQSGLPATSYVPFVCVEGSFAVAVSGLAAHTVHLRERPEASVLALDASYEGDVFARPRLSAAVAARFVTPGSASSQSIWDALERRHGETVAMLRTLADFTTILLAPLGGRIVMGFAVAHDMDAVALRLALTSCAADKRDSGATAASETRGRPSEWRPL